MCEGIKKEITMLKTAFFPRRVKYYRWCTVTFCTQPTYMTNICIQKGLIIFNIVGAMLCTDNAGRRTPHPQHYTIRSQMS